MFPAKQQPTIRSITYISNLVLTACREYGLGSATVECGDCGLVSVGHPPLFSAAHLVSTNTHPTPSP